MVLTMARPTKRPNLSFHQFRKRVPADVLERAEAWQRLSANTRHCRLRRFSYGLIIKLSANRHPIHCKADDIVRDYALDTLVDDDAVPCPVARHLATAFGCHAQASTRHAARSRIPFSVTDDPKATRKSTAARQVA